MSAENDTSHEIGHPRTAPRLIGHRAAATLLAGQLTGGRPHHAWLLTGPRGVGKAAFAYAAAKAVLTGAAFGSGGGPDGPSGPLSWPEAHPAALHVAQGAATSLFIYERRIDPKSGRLRTRIDVDQVRETGARFHLHTADGGWRVAIVDSVNELNPSSANALLKLLEEPPNKTLFLLINHAGGFVLPTIRSRCLTLPFGPLSPAELTQVIEQSGQETDEPELIHKLAGGSAGRALEMISANGPSLYRDLIGILQSLPNRDDDQLHKMAGKLTRSREAPEYVAFTGMLQDWLAKLGNMAARGTPPETAAYIGEEAALLKRFVALGGVDRWGVLWEKTATLFYRAEHQNLDRKQTLLDAFYGLQQAMRA